jgi:gliding motility-associated-like protein
MRSDKTSNISGMKKIILFFALFMIFGQVKAQVQSPILTTISYKESLNKFVISWNDPNSFNPDTFLISVYSGKNTPGGVRIYDEIGFTDGTTYSFEVNPQFTINGTTYDLFNKVYFFAVEAVKFPYKNSSDNKNRIPYVSEPSNVLLNLTQTDFDSCNYTITLRWNKFYGWDAGDVQKYQISYRTGTGSFTLWQVGGSAYFTDTSIVISVADSGKAGTFLQFDKNYSFQIVDVNQNKSLNCFSNIRTISTNIPTKPKFINADGTEILSDNQHIQLSFTVDTGSEMHDYSLYRSDSYNGTYQKIHTFNNTGITVIDNDTVDALSKPYFYKLEVLNVCLLKINESGIESSIILTGGQSGNANNLNWNAYQEFKGGLRDYTVYRSIQGRPFIGIATTTGTSYTDNFGDSITEKGFITISYYVIATESSNYYDISGTRFARSNTIAIVLDQKITMPEFFTPDGKEPVKNDYYLPPVAYQTKSYKFIVYDRWGTRLFETSDPNTQGWDGKVNGKAAPQGAYIYYLKIVGSDNTKVEQKGSFLLVLPK